MRSLSKIRCAIGMLAFLFTCSGWTLTTDLVPERGDLFLFKHDGKAAGYNFIQYGPLRNPTTGKFLKDASGNEIWGKIPSGLPPTDGRSCRLVFKEADKTKQLPPTGDTPYMTMLARSEVNAMPTTPALGQLYSHKYLLSGNDHVESIECFLSNSTPLDFFQILAIFGQLPTNENVVNIQRGTWQPWEEQVQTGANFENVVRDYIARMSGLGEADARHNILNAPRDPNPGPLIEPDAGPPGRVPLMRTIPL